MGQKGRLRTIWGLKRALFAHLIAFWELLGGAPKVQKCVSDANPVNIGQLDHYVVFGTKSGALQDFQRDKKGTIGVKQTPLTFLGST